MTDDLFGTAPPKLPHNHTRTSIDAARQVSTVERDRRMILAYLYACGDEGGTDEEIQRHCRSNGNSERPRRTGLVEDGLVAQTDKKRRTLSGRMAVVWRITEAGRKEFLWLEFLAREIA